MNHNDGDKFNILDKITDGFYILDDKWNYIYLNNTAEKILNRTKEELLGKCIWNVFEDAVYLPLYNKYMVAVQENKSVEFDFYYPSMKSWFEVRAYPTDEGLSVLFLDITNKKNISITKEQYYQSLFANNPDAVYIMDLNGHFTSINDAVDTLAGYKKQELIGKNYGSLVVDEDYKKVRTFFEQAKEGKPQHFETRIIHKTRRIVYCSITNIPIIIDGKLIGIYGIAKDITLQKVAEDNLEKAEKLSIVGQLSASIAHEIRNPLTTLKGFLQLLEGEEGNVGNEGNYFKIMLEEMDRIDLITSELLFLAKPQAVEYYYEDINAILKDVILLLQSEALMNDIDIQFEYQSVKPIYCVKNQIKQVFINIIKNAMESMSHKGVIKVKLIDYDHDTIIIEVDDQGCGISEELAPQIGLPFYSTKERGTGLGMVTTYKIIQEHGGKINFESEKGVGTTFRIYLPKD
ncbi:MULTISPECIES: PAS domain S-box protein [Bacillaceae]|uniref:histidine kinase n=1 Tax=Evansella alkalicola TaxID=745819 RepID=A0ABS6JXR5_9BACI|nr:MULTISPECIES: PAS domain S-box protein [Bacillaceae]MBU9723377.1 PAS domain S-box protein [Bacillus alkalicola]